MDISNILQAITLCVKAQSQDEIQRGQSFLAQSAIEPGYPLKLMMIADRSDLEINIRQFAVTDLKNSIVQFWRAKNDKPAFSEEDKSTVRNSLLDALIRSVDNSKLSKMYCKIILDVCAFDFPSQWPNLVEQAIAKMSTSENQSEIYGCCLALQQVFNNLQFEMEERETLENIVQLIFPQLQALIGKLMGVYSATSAYLLKPILRSFYMCINIDLPKFLQNYDVLSQWIGFLKLLINSEIPSDLTSPTQSESVIVSRDNHPLWKNKKWAGRILTKFITRFSNKKIVVGQQMQAIVQWLVETHLESIMQCFVKLLVTSQTQFVGSMCLHFSLKFLIKVFKHNSLYTALQPYIETILYDSLFPLLFLTPRDSELWESDPQEFIRQEDDLFGGNMRNHKNLAMELIREIVVNPFSKNHYLHQFIQFIVTCIETNANPRTNVPISLAVRDGIFFAIGKLKEQIYADSEFKSSIEQLLEKYILPQLSNSNPFIRSRCCWVFGRYGFIDFRNAQNVVTAVNGITACLKDEHLPVKFKAALALNCLIKQSVAQEMVKAYLSEILRIYIKLMDEIDSEELVAALEGIVAEFSKDIGPFAYDLALHLSSAFFKYREKENEQDQEDDDECSLAAGGCLDAIGKILSSPIAPEVLLTLEEVILPIVNQCLIDDDCDYMDECLHLLQSMVFKATSISNSSPLWFYFPILIYIVAGNEKAELSAIPAQLTAEQKLMIQCAVSGWGQEHLHEVVIILKNFIQKGGDFLFTATDLFGVRFIDLIFSFVGSVYTKCAAGTFEDEEESAMKDSLSVLYCLLENRVTDQKISGPILAGIIQLTLHNLSRDKLRNEVLVSNLETLCLCFYYNAQETFQVLLNSFGVAIVHQLFQRWFALLKHFKTDFANQRLLLAFASILTVSNLPDEISRMAPEILKRCVSISTDILKLREEDEFEDDEDDDEDDENDQGKNSKGAANHDKGFADTLEAHISKIQEFNNRKATGGMGSSKANDPVFPDDSDDGELDGDYDPLGRYHYNYSYDCPLENIDEIIFLESKLIEIAQANAAYYGMLTQLLSEQDKATLQSNIAASKKQYEEYLQSKQNPPTTTA